MPRTAPINSLEIVTISDQSEPISVTPYLIDRLLTTGDYANLIALYLFYYRTARYQKTNQPWATISFVATGLGWGTEKVAQKKQALVRLGLIEEIQEKRDDGTFGKMFIKVNYIHGFIQPIQGNDRPPENTGDGKIPVPVKSDANALSGKRGNALSDINTTDTKQTKSKADHPQASPDDKNKHYLPVTQQLADIIQSYKNIEITPSKIKAWSIEIRRLCQEHKINPFRIKQALTWYASQIGQPFVPVILCGSSLRTKFLQLEAAVKRSNEQPTRRGAIVPTDPQKFGRVAEAFTKEEI